MHFNLRADGKAGHEASGDAQVSGCVAFLREKPARLPRVY